MQTLKTIWAAVWRILVFFVAWAGLTSALVVPVISKYAPPHGAPLPLWLRLYIETVSLLTILVAAWLMVRFVDRRPFVSLGFARKHAARDSVIGLTVGLGMMATCAAILYVIGWATWSTDGSFAGSALAIATLAMLLNTVTQEVLVRGYVQQTLQSQFGTLAGVIVSSVFFLALHLGAIGGQLLPALSLFSAGVLLATCYAVTGELWLPIALHFGWNVLQGPVLGQAVSGQELDAGNELLKMNGPEFITGGKFGIEGGLIAVAITILGTPLILFIYHRLLSRKPARAATS
jgi:membrane protease YdiL (CAAX protease family)